MQVSRQATEERSLCAVVAKECREDPIGSIFLPDYTVLVEVPLPWASAVWSSPSVAPELRDAVAGLERSAPSARCYAIAPDAELSFAGYTRVLTLRRPQGLYARLEREEFLVPAGQAATLLAALARRGPALERFERYRQPVGDTRDLLVCTHGSKDVCCGKLGFPLYHLLREQYARRSLQPLRVWRISHIGGHRFAPTLIDAPAGHAWAYLEPEMLERVLHPSGPVHELMPYYRGWGGLPGYYLQLAERAILLREGWSWLEYRRSGRVLLGRGEGYPIRDDEAEPFAVVRIDYQSSDGLRGGSYEAAIERYGRVLTALSCHRAELDHVHQYRVTNLLDYVSVPTRAAALSAAG